MESTAQQPVKPRPIPPPPIARPWFTPPRKQTFKIGALRLVAGAMILLGLVGGVGGCFAALDDPRKNPWEPAMISWGVFSAGLIVRLLAGVWARLDDIAELLRERK